MPEMPEVQAHAERLTEAFGGAVLQRFTPLTFTALKTVTPGPETAHGTPLAEVGRRGKHLLLRFPDAPVPAPTGDHTGDHTGGGVTFVVHLMQGGRLRVDEKQAARPRNGQARWRFDDGRALLLTEAGTERKAGVWVVAGDPGGQPPLDHLGPEASEVDRATLATLLAEHPMRLHGWLRDQRVVAGLGRRLANEICHRAKRRCLHRRVAGGRAGARRHVVVQGAAGCRPPPRGPAVPGVRRHGARRRVPLLHDQLLPHVPDRRQGAGRQHHQPVPQVSLHPRQSG